MKLTNEIIEKHGFKRINNSMFRFKNITLQNSWKTSGANIYERIINNERAYKVCVNGKFKRIITKESELTPLKIIYSD